MKQILRCDWLPERARRCYLAAWDYALCPANEISPKPTQVHQNPYKKYFHDQACSVKMLASLFFACSRKKELGQYIPSHLDLTRGQFTISIAHK